MASNCRSKDPDAPGILVWGNSKEQLSICFGVLPQLFKCMAEPSCIDAVFISHRHLKEILRLLDAVDGCLV